MLHSVQIDAGVETHEYYWGHSKFGYSVDHRWDASLTVCALFLYVCISGLFILHLWRANPDESVFTKISWTVILLIPLIGWLAYMNFGPRPKMRERSRREY